MIRNHKQATPNRCRFSRIQTIALVSVPQVLSCGGLAHDPLVMMPRDPECHQGSQRLAHRDGRVQPPACTYPCLIYEDPGCLSVQHQTLKTC